MKQIVYFSILIFLLAGFSSKAQQRMDPKGMTYVMTPKPNIIIFHDTVYAGSKQFKQLFCRTNDMELISLVERHQTNKIISGIIVFAGTVATIVGINKLSSADQKGTGWALIGGGFAGTLLGGYLTYRAQQNLQMAVSLFNQRNHRAALGLGISQNTAGLVYKF